MNAARDKTKGTAYLVGAGPGRADLITVRGAEVLGLADCIIYDKLANPALLRFARPDAEIIHVPKRAGRGSFTQDQVNKLLIEKASAGATVVRLKGGDPCMFGRCAEEVALLADAGIDFEIVPGITAAVAAADYTGILLTSRDYSSQVAFVTGHEAEGKQESNINWAVLAKFDGTIAFYMGMGNLSSIAERLIENGMSKNIPAAVIANATLPTQRVAKAPLAKIDRVCREEEIKPPAIVVIGCAADSDPRLDWFKGTPLFGNCIVVTRDSRGNAEFAAKIVTRGGYPIEFATMAIKPLTDTNLFSEILTKLAEYDWIVFTSRNGVAVFFDALRNSGRDARALGPVKIAAIGSETAAKLDRYGVAADFVPSLFTGRELGEQLLKSAKLRDKKVLLLRSAIASDELVDILEQGGAEVKNVAVYTVTAEKGKSDWLTEQIERGSIHWLTFASPSSARMFFERIPGEIVNSSSAKIASIGPVTSKQLQQLGISVHVTAKEHTIYGLLAAIEGMPA